MSSDLKNKMLQWETKPPEEAWNKIAAALETDDEYAFSQKLSSFQSEPPRHVWEQIEAGLEARSPGRIIPLNHKRKLIFQYSSAAAALIFIAVLISLFVTNRTGSNELAQQSTIQSLPDLQKTTPPLDTESVTNNSHNEVDSQVASHQTSTDLVVRESNSSIPKQSSKASTYRKGKSRGYNAIITEWEDAKDSLVNRYFVHTNNRGEAIRLSSKLYDLFECSNEWTERECAQQIKLWQQKAATSVMCTSADFTGVLEILKSMQEGE